MGAVVTAANTVFRDHRIAGNTASRAHTPEKAAIRALFATVETAIAAGTTSTAFTDLQEDVTDLQAQVTDLADNDNVSAIDPAERPGDAPDAFTSVVAGDGADLAHPPAGEIVINADGAALRVSGEAIVASRRNIAVESGKTYAARWVFRRFTNPFDPAGDATRAVLAWLDNNKVLISETEAFEGVVSTFDGQIIIQATFSLDGAADFTAPSGTRYVRGYIQTFGVVNSRVDIEVIDLWASNGLTGPQGDVGDVTPAAEAARDAAIAAAAQAEAAANGIVATDVATITIPMSVTSFRTTGYSDPGDGGAALYKRVVSEPAHGGKLEDATGEWFELAETRPSAAMFGAKGDGVDDDTAALQEFITFSDCGMIQSGTYKVTNTLSFRSDQYIVASGDVIISYEEVAPSDYKPVLYFSNISNSKLTGSFTLKAPSAAYPTARVVMFDTAINCEVSGGTVDGGGGTAMFAGASNGCKFKDITIIDCARDFVELANSNHCLVEGIKIPNAITGFMGIKLYKGSFNKVLNNHVENTQNEYFGIYCHSSSYVDVMFNIVRNARREAIAVGAGIGDGHCQGAKINYNTVEWTLNLGVGDFGMSFAGGDADSVMADFEVIGNIIINSAYDGIGVAGFCQRGRIAHNHIRDCARDGNADHIAGIKVYGYITGAFCENLVIEHNTVAKISGGFLALVVNEVPGLGSLLNNIIRGNNSIGITAAANGSKYVATSGQLALNDEDLTLKIHSGTPTALTGTITSGAFTLRYQQVGKFVYCELQVTIETNGTGAGQVRVTTPFVFASGALNGRDNSNGQAVFASRADASILACTLYNNSYPGVNGSTFVLTGLLRLA